MYVFLLSNTTKFLPEFEISLTMAVSPCSKVFKYDSESSMAFLVISVVMLANALVMRVSEVLCGACRGIVCEAKLSPFSLNYI